MERITPNDVEDVEYGEEENMREWEDEQLAVLYFDNRNLLDEDITSPSGQVNMVNAMKILRDRGYEPEGESLVRYED
jgi:hypothetical protein